MGELKLGMTHRGQSPIGYRGRLPMSSRRDLPSRPRHTADAGMYEMGRFDRTNRCSTGWLGGLALQQAAPDLVSGDELDGSPRSAAGTDSMAANRLNVGAVVQHRKHCALADGAAVGRFRVRLHRSIA